MATVHAPYTAPEGRLPLLTYPRVRSIQRSFIVLIVLRYSFNTPSAHHSSAQQINFLH